jgi:hypothetical protein
VIKQKVENTLIWYYNHAYMQEGELLVDPLLTARFIAQELGENRQGDIGQALQGTCPDFIIETLEEIGEKTGLGFDGAWKMAEFVSGQIGRGQPTCANWMTWAVEVISGNIKTFVNMKPTAREELLRMSSAKTHPEFQEIVDSVASVGRNHFSARRIPRVSIEGSNLLVNWPRHTDPYDGRFNGIKDGDIDISETIGGPQSLIKLEG